MLDSRILSFILGGTAYFAVNDTAIQFSYLATAIEEQVAERGWLIFWAKLKACMEAQKVQIFLF